MMPGRSFIPKHVLKTIFFHLISVPSMFSAVNFLKA